ncbi:Etfdh [Symbiodinium pilosum]|uniref:Etfdh protein n=1 Tax=Symbiodinium pilosum TaxID=2952 RepID=A0A812IU03_SYMPI|nr:Etfdh [Symbiodinium pilosum]
MFEFDTAIASRRRIGLSLICVDSALLKSKLRAQFSEPCANITYHTSHASVLKVLSEGRKRLGFDQAWMPDSDFQIYNSEDEEAGPLKGKMRDNGLIDFTYEVHLYYEPK